MKASIIVTLKFFPVGLV